MLYVQYTMQHADGKAAVGPVIEDSNTHSLSTTDLSGGTAGVSQIRRAHSRLWHGLRW
jgi:hypothetical protein